MVLENGTLRVPVFRLVTLGHVKAWFLETGKTRMVLEGYGMSGGQSLVLPEGPG